nr:immunoglobulin heavy chain junction region [Mus musculus]
CARGGYYDYDGFAYW